MDNKEAVLMLKLICGYAISHEKLYTESDKIVEAVHKSISALQSDPNGPDWSQAPDWAEWYAKDKTGVECWFENEPLCVNNTYFASSGKMDYCTKKPFKAIIKRPE